MVLIGRNDERKIVEHCLQASESKLIVIYGRRRVGKTFFVREHLGAKIKFEISGLHDKSTKEQLGHFASTLAKYGLSSALVSMPTNWRNAFDLLQIYLDGLKGTSKKVLFFDEMPWFDTPKSKFLPAFENFWNSYCSKRKDIVLICCGSAAAWIIKKILFNKGGLHNRVSEKIQLNPFSLYETELFLRQKSIRYSKYDIAQLYMVTGGVPFYLDNVRKGESVHQFIDRACFKSNGILVNEYNELFKSLFKDSHYHSRIVSLLAIHGSMDRETIAVKAKLPAGGTLSDKLAELEASGFIQKVVPYEANVYGAIYKLIDFFTLFHFRFMVSGAHKQKESWLKKIRKQTWVTWSGLAFERICQAHRFQIIKALGLQAIEAEVYTWSKKNDSQGAQIDLLIDRGDRVINICEIKFYDGMFSIDKSYAAVLRNKLSLFASEIMNKKKTIFLTMITTFGVSHNEYFSELVQNELVLNDLFGDRSGQ